MSSLPRPDQQLEDRITVELRDALYGLASTNPLVTVFGSARALPESATYRAAREFATQNAAAGFGVITGGGPGIMEAANRGAREAGAPSLGASIMLPHEQDGNDYLDREVRFSFFFARKLALLRASCGFICFPGGFGTADELFEALTLIQTGKLPHFPIVLFGMRYWGGLIEWLETTMEQTGAIAARDRGLLLATDSIAEAVALFQQCHQRLCMDLGSGPQYPK